MTQIRGKYDAEITVEALHNRHLGQKSEIRVTIYGRDEPTARIRLDAAQSLRLIKALEKERA